MGLLNSLKEKISRFLDVYIKLIKINLIGRTADLLSYLMYGMILLFILFSIILFLGFGFTEIFVEAGLTRMASMFITTGIYVFFLAVIIGCRRQLTRFFASGIVNVLTEVEEKGKKDEE